MNDTHNKKRPRDDEQDGALDEDDPSTSASLIHALAQEWGGFIQASVDMSKDDPTSAILETEAYKQVISRYENCQKVIEVAHLSYDLFNKRLCPNSMQLVDQLNSPLVDELVNVVGKVSVDCFPKNKRHPQFVNQYLFHLTRNGSLRAWRFLMALPFPPVYAIKANNIPHCISIALRWNQLELFQFFIATFPQYHWSFRVLEQLPEWGQDKAFLAYWAIRPPGACDQPAVDLLIRKCAANRCIESQRVLLQEMNDLPNYNPDLRFYSHFKNDDDTRFLQAYFDHGVHLVKNGFQKALESFRLPYVVWYMEHYPELDPWRNHRGLGHERVFWRYDAQAPILDYLLTIKPPPRSTTDLQWLLHSQFTDPFVTGALGEVCRKHLGYSPNSIELGQMEHLPTVLVTALGQAVIKAMMSKLTWLVDTVGVPWQPMTDRILGWLICFPSFPVLDFFRQRGLVVPVNLEPVIKASLRRESFNYQIDHYLDKNSIAFVDRLVELGGDLDSLTEFFSFSKNNQLQANLHYLNKIGVPIARIQVPQLVAEGKLRPSCP